MNEIAIADTTLRDGQSSLWALSMRTSMILPIARQLDRAGFYSIELMSGALIKKCVRELREDPWERLRLVAREIVDTPLRVNISRYMEGFQITPPSLAQLWLERLAVNGIRQIRISDPSNTFGGIASRVEMARRAGLDPVVNLIFSESPRHTDPYYARLARQVAGLRPTAVCIKDPGALLTPERTRTLVPAVMDNVEGRTVELHTHCTTGLGPLCCLDAARLGVRIIDTAIPPLANGSSNPSLFNVLHNLAAEGFTSRVDLAASKLVGEHFAAVARRHHLPFGVPAEYDSSHYLHQVPGGMISHFRHHLAQLGVADRLPEVLEETARVRAEFGYPIMVTPYSQFIGTQAVLNVIFPERYAQVPDEVIQYALGIWGEDESSSIEPDVRDRILARRRAQELAGWRPSEPSIEEIRRALGGASVSDDELIMRYVVGNDAVDSLRAAAAPHDHPASATHPLVALVQELAGMETWRSVHVSRDAWDLRLDARRGLRPEP